jgi:hypothetical protein
LICFLGAEFTQVYATQYGFGVAPAENAEPIANKKEKRHSQVLALGKKRRKRKTGSTEDCFERGAKTNGSRTASRCAETTGWPHALVKR